MRLIAAALWPLAVLMFLAAPARADVGGDVPAPGLCDYPSICTSGNAFGAYDYAETWPMEVNGSNRVCLLGGAMFQGTAGVSIMFVNASVTTPLGVIRGACWYACPGPLLEKADWPNPPGAWKNYLKPAVCKPVGPAPVPINPPPPPADAPPPGAPIPVPPAPQLPLPNATNPVPPNGFEPEPHR